MSVLEKLNNLQTKLQSAKESLQESDGWGNLLNELEDCFERNDLNGVCERLVALQKSLQAQEQLPGHAERQSHVEDFKNRLEALASPNVVQCFAEANVNQAKTYVDIFVAIERLPQLLQYYRAVHKSAMQQQWKQAIELQATEISPQQHHFLTYFYNELLEHSQRQIKWCAQVFTDDVGLIQPFVVVAELLPSLQPSRDQHILQLLKTSNDRLELLEQFAQANRNFVLQLNATLKQCNLTLTKDLTLQVGESVYEYFHKFIQQYPRIEETQLSTQIDKLITNQASAGESVRHLENSTRKVFDWLTEAFERCAQITNDLALCKLIGLLGGIFKRVLENFSKTQRQISLTIGTGGNESWSILQYTMSLLQCLADFQYKLNKFENILHERMSDLADKLNNSSHTKIIDLYATYDRGEQTRLLNAINEYQQNRVEVANSQIHSLGIFSQVYDSLKTHFIEAHDITLNILLQPIDVHLSNIQPPTGDANTHSPIATADMPSFSFAPQECITQIGQYLLTLPQHLEPLLLSPSSLLKQALEMCNVKYTQSIPCADILLSLVVEQCCIMYQTQILQIKSINSTAAKQLSVDIEYLSNVIEELGLNINQQLSQILTLLKATPENYRTSSSGCEPRLVSAIRQMRNIISTQ
ncbi:conserved oligomeric Golgi complex subunit 7-like [Teleopsis dalmanni]|nr:conserved oligomeric Golgi complex subunit 7-like [Teleopsis dalmanni]